MPSSNKRMAIGTTENRQRVQDGKASQPEQPKQSRRPSSESTETRSSQPGTGARQLRAERPHHTGASTRDIFKNSKKGWVGASWPQRFNSAFVTNILVDPVFVFLDHL